MLYHAYHAYHPYPRKEIDQILRYLRAAINGHGKDGKARKGHVIQTFWYESKFKISHHVFWLLSSFREHISL